MCALASESPFLYLVPLWPIFLVGIWAVWNMIRDSRQEKTALRAANWPEIQGKVTSSKVAWGHYEVAYEFVFRDRSYRGTHLINLSPVVPGRASSGARFASEAKQDLSDFPPGSDVIIKYNPQEPSNSILLCRGQVGQTNAQVIEPPKFLTLS